MAGIPHWVDTIIDSLKEMVDEGVEIKDEMIEALLDTTEEREAKRALAESALSLDENPSIWGGEPYKMTDGQGTVLQGPFGANPNRPTVRQSPPLQDTPDKPADDYLNALLAASLMQGQKPEMGRQGQIAYGVGAQVQAADPYKMYRDWEQSYRRI